MERSGNTAPKVDDVTSAAEETVQFDDDNLRGEKLKKYIYIFTFCNKYISGGENTLSVRYQCINCHGSIARDTA